MHLPPMTVVLKILRVVSLIEEQLLISLETSFSRMNDFNDCEKFDLLPDDRMILRNHKRVGKSNTDKLNICRCALCSL